ncbi:MAG: hypothetical protein AB4352_06555 [Hormoscilla sp.]
MTSIQGASHDSLLSNSNISDAIATQLTPEAISPPIIQEIPSGGQLGKGCGQNSLHQEVADIPDRTILAAIG